ncbi:MAG: hypothetical protein ACQKBY_00785 [Verrucomicrobiales bacterium]
MMRTWHVFGALCGWFFGWQLALGADFPDVSQWRLVDEVDLTSQEGFKEFPAGASELRELLGRQSRCLSNEAGGVKYFGYLLGQGKGLQGGGHYLLEIEYPQDVPRTMMVMNRGDGMTRGFHTGATVGDALSPHYVNNAPESLALPLSGKSERVRYFMTLQDRTSEIAGKRKAEVPDEKLTQRTLLPEDGFWVYLAQFAPEQSPLSAGVAVSAIRLYEVPDLAEVTVKAGELPEDLPRRHVFFREEMADGVLMGEADERGFENRLDWFEGKAALCRFLGMNTLAKDLLEFGHNQGWNPAKHGGWTWVYPAQVGDLWPGVVEIARQHGLSLLPYYEYAGSVGRDGLGPQRRARPLGGENYTHVSWAEKNRADLTEEETFADFWKMLDITVVDQKEKGDFIGVWLRPRGGQLPVSFSDAALGKFAAEKREGKGVTRAMLQQDKALYAAYLDWWRGERKDFLTRVRDELRKAGVAGAEVFYTADVSEPGFVQPGGERSGLVAEDPALWKGVALKKAPVALSQALEEQWSLRAQTEPHWTWGKWEWQHAVPEQDPENYRESEGIYPTLSFNRRFTVDDAETLQAFSKEEGLAMVRHFSLNEDMLRIKGGKNGKDLDPLGYFSADVEYAGPFIMMAEVRAMAAGNPTRIGYLSSNQFNRASPEYVREFHAAYLSLPALPAREVPQGDGAAGIVVKQFKSERHGTWFAVINPGYEACEAEITLPLAAGEKLRDAVSGKELEVSDGKVSVQMRSCQLLAWRTQ